MKRLLSVCLFFAVFACTKYEEFPLRPVSFEIDDIKYYSAKDTRTVFGNIFNIPEPDTLRILEYGDSLSVTYGRFNDFLQHTMKGISLDITGMRAAFETGTKIYFDESDQLQGYPAIYMQPIKSTSASEYDTYIAQDGWIEFYEINWDKMYISGRFEFEAALSDEDDCVHDKVIEVKKGAFENIPFSFSRKSNQQEQ